jgi:hypothetical protein
MEIPVIEDHSGHLGTFTTVAERRMIVTKRDYSSVPGEDTYNSKFCAEPPPDATQSIARALSAALSGSAAGLKAQPEVSVQFAKSLATTAKTLFQRSQGVQLFRDGVYNLCQAYLNGALSSEQYIEQYGVLLKTASALISSEIEKMPSVPVQRAEEAANASEAAKADALRAKVFVEDSLTKAELAANSAKDAQKAAENSKASLDAAVRKAEEAAQRAEEAAKKSTAPGAG